jgi:hypothetical protein
MKPKPRRVVARPLPEMWSDSEMMSFEEAAALLSPDGGFLTASLLRTASRSGRLETVLLHRKLLTCKRAIREMIEAARRPARIPRADR